MASPKQNTFLREELGPHDDAQPKKAKEHMHDESSKEETNLHMTPSQHEEFRPCIRSSVFAGIGNRPSMEDTHVVMDDAAQLAKLTSLPSSFYAVFDGHGGIHAAEFARDHLFSTFVDFMVLVKSKDVDLALICAFTFTDRRFQDVWLENKDLASGTTALAAVIIGSKLYVANAGDCRAVICRNGKALDMSRDHDPRKNMDEYNRITQAGGFVDKEGYLNGIINMSRAIGDWHIEGLKEPGPLISRPEVRCEDLTVEDEFMIVASDGLFKTCCSSQYAVNYVRGELEKHNDLEKCARHLAQHTWCRQHESNWWTDNSTVVIVSFRKEVAPSE